jgi:hypothetical protein
MAIQYLTVVIPYKVLNIFMTDTLPGLEAEINIYIFSFTRASNFHHHGQGLPHLNGKMNQNFIVKRYKVF